MIDLGNFRMGFGVYEGLQSIGNGCGLQMDGFSAHFEPHGSISNDFYNFDDFGNFHLSHPIFEISKFMF